MKPLSAEYVRPLGAAENHFLEVLLSKFTLTREEDGVLLEVHFDQQTPAIWGRSGVRHLKESIPDFDRRASEIQAELDSFLLLNQGSVYAFDNPEFPFRYASGGTLPVLRWGGKDYYCLFYRDVSPVGWNIANGGCDSRDELRNPLEAAERELREELVVFGPHENCRYVFAGEAGKPVDWPEFSQARRLWTQRLGCRLEGLEERQIPLKLLKGHDRLAVRFGDRRAVITAGGFININALDFGIELDRVAKISVDRNAVLCDGELTNDQLLNCPVALFEVDRFNRTLALGDVKKFIPDLLFHGGQCFDGSELETVINERFLPEMTSLRSPAGMKEFESARNKFDLCPVTRRIIARYLSLHDKEPPPEHEDYRVFISFGSPDRDHASRACDYLRKMSSDPVFCSTEESVEHACFSRAIDDALDSARSFVAVATDPRHLERQWPEFEWRRFHCDMRSNLKQNARIVPYISFDPRDLPGPLRLWDAIVFDPSNPEPALEALARRVR